MNKLIFVFALVALPALASELNPFEGMTLVLNAMENGALTTQKIVAVKRIESTGLVKCLPGIETFEVAAGAAADGVFKEAFLEVEVGGCGSSDLSKQVKLVSEKYN